MDKKLSIDNIYADGANIPRNPVDPVYKELEKAWHDIEWNEVDVTGDQRTALADAAGQLHYSYLSHIQILGEVIKHAPDLQAKRLAIVLANSRMRDVDAWGRYLRQLQTTADIPSTVKEYTQTLASDDHVESRIAGIALADVYGYGIRDRISAITDPTFRALMERDSEQSRNNMRLTETYLASAISQLDTTDRKEVTQTIRRYRELTEDILREQVASFDAFDDDPSAVAAAVTQTADRFFERIGIDK